MSSRKRDREPTNHFATPLERLPYMLISSFILPYLNNSDVKNAYETNIVEIQKYAYSNVMFHIDEVTAESRALIRHVEWSHHPLDIRSDNGTKILPDGLHTLKFEDGFNQPLEKNGVSLLPDSIHTLSFGDSFNQALEYDGQPLLPDGLHTLTFGDDFNHPLEKNGMTILPNGLQTLTFGEYFNQPLEKNGIALLPNGLQTLTFGDFFDQPLEENGVTLLPNGLQTLTLGEYFNHPLEVDGVLLLPDGLKTLSLHYDSHTTRDFYLSVDYIDAGFACVVDGNKLVFRKIL